MKASEIETALAARYCAPEWAFLLQVRNSTGFQRTVRTADALAMSLYPSRGLHLHGFEIKVSKADWKRELVQPDKAEEIARFCHFWWIVTPKGLIDPVGLPVNWGLIEYDGTKLQPARTAVFRKEAEALTLPMIAAIMRKASEGYARMIPPESLTDEVERRVGERIARTKNTDEYIIENLRAELAAYKEFEKASGIRVNRWNYGQMGEAVRLFLEARKDPETYKRQLRGIRDQLTRMVGDADQALAALEPEERAT